MAADAVSETGGKAMKRREFLKEIGSLDRAALQQKGNELAEELMRLRFKQATRQLEQSHRLGQTRRSLARVQSLLKSQAKAK